MTAVSSGRGSQLTANKHTKWPLILLSLVMSLLSLLSKEQGVTVIGVCAAFDVFINWTSLLDSFLIKRKKTEAIVSNEKTAISLQETRVTRASIASSNNNIRNSHINGLASSTTKKKSRPNNSGSELYEFSLRIGKANSLT